MKILFLSAANSIHTVKWANAMVKRGHSVSVVSCNNQRESNNKFDDAVDKYYLRYNSGIGYYLNAIELRKIVKEIVPDVINVHYASGYGTLARIARLKNYLLNIWGSDVYSFPKESIIKKLIFKKNLEYATELASTSVCMAEEIKKYSDKRVFITPFGVDINLFKPNKKENRNIFKFCTIKTLLPNYGILGIIESIKLLIDRLDSEKNEQKIIYEIYGEGPQKGEICAKIKELGLDDVVFLRGYVQNSQLAEVINDKDVFLLNSVAESFGVAAVEAMACEKPVIASDADGFKEVIVNGESGLIINKMNRKEYADAMYMLLFDKKKRDFLSKNARLRVEQLYNWEKNADYMEGLYKNMQIKGDK